MTPEQFIETNVKAELMKLGFSLSVASLATNEAIRYYRQSKSTQRGKMMANCLDVAKQWVGRNSVKQW
ncbi:MAG TPA: hypothetical protein ACHBZA_07465 [Arsenophonus apicola]|uniref:hypothetical protein n=1 Tax=Arsenophonus TaxID=637 RepID=UPI0015D716F1|nr:MULTISPECIES: hypothetical protein [Arsenophonus]UBX27920.1 hypothetical protein LDL57_08485 [Arsenophonus apicola]UBX30014.1 hypothetical protein LDL57_05150 [Arsenophonus apicola]UBX30223.1 hypothetical protein LDL57_06360 [Arsenophonus apicola]